MEKAMQCSASCEANANADVNAREMEWGEARCSDAREAHPFGEKAKWLLAREQRDLDVFGSALHHFEQSAQCELQGAC